jgi:hypothetical protein
MPSMQHNPGGSPDCRHCYPPGRMHCARCGHKMGHGTWLFKVTQTIRNSYADGVPLSRSDRQIILGVLRMHPEGRRKFGAGVGDVFVHRYIQGSRRFWVVHPDGSAEAFSVRKALRKARPNRSAAISAAMAAFDTRPVLAAYRAAKAVAR